VGDALQRLGHEVTQLGAAHTYGRGPLVNRAAALARHALPRLDERAQGKIARAALDADCEIVVNLDAYLMPRAVTRLRNNGVRVAFWFPDAVSNLGRQLMLLAPYDAIFFKEPWLVDHLRATLGLPVYYLPEACNPRWHRPVVPAGTESCLVIAGNMYPSRVRLLERLIAKGIPLKLYGSGFPRWIGETPARAAHTGRTILREEKARVFRSAAGVLNTMHPAEINGVNSRLFEAAGCGAAVLTEFRPTIPELFTIGQEMLVFHDFDELVEQATRLLGEQGLTARLGDAAAHRAHRDHTFDLRATAILEKLLGPVVNGPPNRKGRRFVTDSSALEAEPGHVLLHPVPCRRVARPRESPAKRGHQARDVPARVDLAHPGHEVGRRANPVGDDGKHAGGHRLVEDKAPVLRFARQDDNVGSVVVGRQFRLIDEACHHTVTGRIEDRTSSASLLAGRHQELVFIAGKQIDIPGDRNAEPGVYARRTIGQEQDIYFDPSASGHQLIAGSVVLDRVEIDDAKPDLSLAAGGLDASVHDRRQ
jgi:spore maturation protein CgeB